MKPRSLTPSGSAFLDCVRFMTAMIVFLGHLGAFIPSTVFFTSLAHIAVCIFFVLSGFVIRMVTRTRLSTMRDFLIDRASRIYSVAIPALLITVLCEGAAAVFFPRGYGPQASPFLWSHVPGQLLANLTFTAQCWGYEINPLSNSPFWSLSFECVYYVLFALLLYGGRRPLFITLALLVALVAGPSIVLLFPIWLLGCLLYDAYIWLDQKSYAFALTSFLMVITLAAAVLLRHPIAHLLEATDLTHRTLWLQQVLPASLQSRFADHYGIVPWLDRASFSFYIAGIITSIAMLWVLITIDRFCPRIPQGFAKRLRWVAEGTFALYLFHLPMVILVASIANGAPRFPIAWAAAIVVLCILAASYLDIIKTSMRHWLRSAFPARS